MDAISQFFQGLVPAYLRELLNISKKSELKKLARKVEIRELDLRKLIMAAPFLNYRFEVKGKDFRDLELPQSSEVEAFRDLPLDRQLKGLEKLKRKISEYSRRSRYLSAYAFVSSKQWHVFYFDQRDIEIGGDNQFKKGSHIHFVNSLWPRYTFDQVWRLLDERRRR
jgi:hypothetical protein